MSGCPDYTDEELDWSRDPDLYDAAPGDPGPDPSPEEYTAATDDEWSQMPPYDENWSKIPDSGPEGNYDWNWDGSEWF